MKRNIQNTSLRLTAWGTRRIVNKSWLEYTIILHTWVLFDSCSKECLIVHTWQGRPQQNSFHHLLRRWGGVLGGGRDNLYRTGPYQCFPSNRALVAVQAFLGAKERQEISCNLACFLPRAVCERPQRLIGNYDSKKHNQLLLWRGFETNWSSRTRNPLSYIPQRAYATQSRPNVNVGEKR